MRALCAFVTAIPRSGPTMFNEYDVVRLTEDLTPSLKAGTRAVVVMVYGGNPPPHTRLSFSTTIIRRSGSRAVRENQIRIDESVRG